MTMRRLALLLLALASSRPTGAAEAPPVWRIEAQGPIAADPKVACTVRIVPDAAGAPAPSWTAQIKVRGSTSQIYDKKSFALKFERPLAPFDLPAAEEWILNAAFVDCSLMRHKLSYDLFRAMGTPAQPRSAAQSRFVEVELNGRYHGAYLLMQPVSVRMLGFVSKETEETIPAVLYKAVDHAANFGAPGHEGFDARGADPSKGPVWTPLDELNRFVSQASDHDFLDPKEGIGRRLDLANAIDFHLLVLLTSNVDGITKNYYLARRAATPQEPSPRFCFVPWDYDATFGQSWDGSPLGAKEWLSNRLFDRLWADPATQAAILRRWRELRQGPFRAEQIAAQIDANARALGPASRRNEQRWKKIDYAAPRELTFEEDIRRMKAWTIERLAWLDTEIGRRAH